MNGRAAHPPHPPRAALTGRQIRGFWTPLVLTALLMTLAGPVLNAAIGRSSDPTLELAGFWVAFTVMLFLQSVTLASQQATVALADSGGTLRRLAVAGLLVGVVAAAAILAVARTPLGDLVFRVVIPASPRVSELARAVLAVLAPVPILIALRDLAAGVAIRERRTTLVATAAALRVAVLAGLVAVSVVLGRAPGARAAAAALVIAIAAETAALLGATYRHWRPALRPDDEAAAAPYGHILRVAAPLAVATLVWTAVRPVVSAVLGRLPDSDLALAAFGVVLPILLATCSPLWAFHHVSLVLPNDGADLRRVLRSAARVAVLVALGIALVTLTPLESIVLRLGFQLSPALERAVRPALPWLVLAPFCVTARALAQGLLMKSRRTGVMLAVAPLKLGLMAVAGLAAAAGTPAPDGATLAILLILGGDVFDAVVFGLLVHRRSAGGELFHRAAPPGATREEDAAAIAWSLPPPSPENSA